MGSLREITEGSLKQTNKRKPKNKYLREEESVKIKKKKKKVYL